MNGASTSTSFADFDLAHDHLNSYAQGSAGGMYVVQSGDTLSGIAAALWGDASLWYKIAEVNGLSAESALVEGLPLIVPAGVQRNENNAETFKPYDPLEVLGSTAPTAVAAPKPKKSKCGVFGQILLVVIAVAVAAITKDFITAGRILSMGAKIAVAAVSAAVGDVVSQRIGVATGIQEKFSWNQVGLSAINAGVAESPLGEKFANTIGADAKNHPYLRTAAVAAFDDALTQGVGTALGLQKEFSWAGVAASGVSAAIVKKFGGKLKRAPSIVRKIVTSGARALANAATRTLIDGSDFGDNIIAALPSVIGGEIGDAFSDSIFDAIHGDDEPEAPEPAQAKAAPSASANKLSFGVGLIGPAAVLDLVGQWAMLYDEIVVTGERVAPETLWRLYLGGDTGSPSVLDFGAVIAQRHAPGVGQQVYNAAIGNVFADTDSRQQHAYSMFAAADANSRQNAQLAPGFDVFFNNVETVALLAGGGLEWLGSPVLGLGDAYVGRGWEALSGGRVPKTVAGDALLDIGSLALGPEVGIARRSVGAARGLSWADDVVDGLPLSQADWRGVRRFNPDVPAHVLGADAEAQLARAVQSMENMQVVRWGDPIGAHGADVISVNTLTGEVYLWDAKYRSAATALTESATFRQQDSLGNALREARDAIRDTSLLAPDVKARALDNLRLQLFYTRTVGYGEARNSTIRYTGYPSNGP